MENNALNHFEQNRVIQETIVNEINNIFPIVTKTRKLEIENITLNDDLISNDFPKQKEIKLSRKSWQVPVTASFKLIDVGSGKTISTSKNIKIGNIPKLTNRFTMIIDGNEYQTTNQIRRKPGVYARVKANGELENEFNLYPGYNFKMQLDPISNLFYIIIENRKHRLWTLLNILGVADKEIANVWGEKLLEKNKKGALNTEVSEIANIYKKLFKENPKTHEEAIKKLKTYFSSYAKVDADTAEMTLGLKQSAVNGKMLLRASEKLLNIEKGKEKPDDRDSLLYKQIYSVDDLLTAYFDKQKLLITKKLTRSVDLKDKVKEIISTSTFGKPLKSFFTESDLTSTPPQTNPVTIIADWRKTTPMGLGGIGSSHAVTLEARDVHPSHLGFLDPLATPEGGRVGLTVGLSSGIIKEGKNIKTVVIDKKGRRYKLTPKDFYLSYIGFPDQYKIKDGKLIATHKKVKVMHKGVSTQVLPSVVDYYLESENNMFSLPTNLVPFIENTQGNRASMGGRMLQQALSLTNKEAPLVQIKRDDKHTYEKIVGSFLDPVLGEQEVNGKILKNGGVVTKITNDYIHIKRDNGEEVKRGLYNNFPLNQDGFLQSTPLVKEGDKVKWDTPLAENNYNDKGTLALGRNLVTAFMPWKGYNYEDGVVITESAADKLSHTALHKKNIFVTPSKTKFDKEKFMAWYPGVLTQENTNKLNSEGLPIVGKKFLPGDLLAVYLEEKILSEDEKSIRRLNKATFSPLAKKTVEWDEEEPGVVTSVRKNGRNIDIYIKAVHPFKLGDKLSGLWGNKGIVTKIISDSEAPHREDGSPIEVILNPHGIPGRMNIGQILATAAGKIAEKTGKPYMINQFSGENNAKKIYGEMKKLGIKPDEKLTDGKNGPAFEKPIFVGNQYIMKLKHMVKKKAGEHSYGSYDINEQPVGKGAQKIDPMLSYALMAHGAKANLKEMSIIKGRKNDEYWRNLQLGLAPPPPEKNFVFDKMITYMKAAGVNVNKEGSKFRILPLTDSQVKKWSAGELKNPGAMLKGKNLAERKGGLFDRELAGGITGEKWSHIKLAEKIPNPMYEQAIIKVLNLNENSYKRIMNGEKKLNGKTGVSAINSSLKDLNISKEITKTKKDLKIAPESNINKLNNKLRYLLALKDLGFTAEEAYMTQYLPVMPPVFRPVYELPSGDLAVSDINNHYAAVGVLNSSYKTIKSKLSSKDKIKYNNDLYNSVKALQGFIDPITYSNKKYKGILQELSGKQPKHGYIQSGTWSKKQELSARSTVTVEPSLNIDEVGIPMHMAKTIFKPFIVKELKTQGMPAGKALKEVEDFSPVAKKALSIIMDKRPVLLNRAPSLHKHGVQAFKPILSEGKAIKLNPIIFNGFNVDIDGDTMSVHVPVGTEAVSEAYNLLPSKIIFKHGDNSVVPGITHEYIVGLYFLSKLGKETGKSFKTIQEAKKAKLHPTDMFKLKNKKMTIGQYEINKVLPKELRDYSRVMDKSTTSKLFSIIGKKHKSDFPKIINKFKELGNTYSHKRSFTVSITDFAHDHNYRDTIINKYKDKLKTIKNKDKKIELYTKMTTEISDAQDKTLSNKNNLYDLLNSGSVGGGKKGNIRQILSMPGLVKGVSGEAIEIPILKSYGEGIDSADYFNSLYGVRKGTVDRSVNTADSGDLNKSLLNVTRRLIVTTEDCKTRDGIPLDVDDKNIMDRYLSESISGVASKNDLVDSMLLMKLKSSGTKSVGVRSPLTCEAANGVCQLCYGLMPNGQPARIGENVGILESQALTEKSTQLTMRTFHSGGAVSSKSDLMTGFPRLVQLLEVPKKLKDKAILSPVTGYVKSILKNQVGGYDVRIEGYGVENDVTITVPSSLNVIVTKGSKVRPGDRLSDGSVKPQELSQYKGHIAGQQYIVDQVSKIYDDKFYKKGIETVVRGISDNAEITSMPADSQFIRGDKTTISYVNSINKERKKEGLDLIEYKPYFKSIKTLNVDSEDWLTRFYTNRIKAAIQEGASKAVYGDILGKDPIPAYVYGDELKID